ncbi:tautomerase family protein [Mycolicibacterium mengxianglii]|uniref:tautomerase family protein n=1 Tax=Mycolicibacterium mengxianglii TaxID=2736649 RepID=UPI0018D06F6D|nr:tautomerase family protein [Mycolicibacterium mengxianglii]
MPVTDITLLRGRTPEQLTDIADAVQDALVSEFGIPAEDRFQVIHQCERHELIYDRTFMGGPRTDGFVMIRVVVGKERPLEAKRAFFATVVSNLGKRAGVAAEDVFIMLDSVSVDNLSAAGGRPFDPPHLREPGH